MSVLEYAVSVWNPHLVRHIKKMKKVQKFVTRLVPELRGILWGEVKGTQLYGTGGHEDWGWEVMITFKILRGIDKWIGPDCSKDGRWEHRGTAGGWKHRWVIGFLGSMSSALELSGSEIIWRVK